MGYVLLILIAIVIVCSILAARSRRRPDHEGADARQHIEVETDNDSQVIDPWMNFGATEIRTMPGSMRSGE
jgi:hypothetical protein